jgi:Xaa-Pro dipeptidase
MTTGQSPNLAFSREEFADRLRRTREGLVSRGLDAGIFFAAESIYYLSGYDAPSHYAFQLLVVPVDQVPFMVMRQHMASGFWATSWLDKCITYADGSDTIEVTRAALIDRKLAGARLGLEEIAPPLTVQTLRTLVAALPNARFSDCSGIVEALRLVKTPREIDYLRKGAQVCDVGVVAATEAVAAGVSEEEIAAEVTRRMILGGGEYQVMPVLVGIEERSRLAIPGPQAGSFSPGQPGNMATYTLRPAPAIPLPLSGTTKSGTGYGVASATPPWIARCHRTADLARQYTLS